jgi:F-type H+-transporting ATPase subunit a
VHLLALHFPPISHILVWKGVLFKDTIFEVNKTVILMWIAVALISFLFITAGRRGALVPTGVQNVVESGVDFIRNGVILEVMGPEGMVFAPFLVSMFFFVFFLNIYEIIPGIQFPVTSRMAVPLFLALTTWVIYNLVGIKSQGFFGYLKNSLFPPGVPKALYLLVVPIEFISNFIVRPFSLAVRLFANLLAGHILLTAFFVLSAALWTKSILVIVLPLPFMMAIFLTGFEILVSVLQAYIFTILTAVYIGGAMHPEH